MVKDARGERHSVPPLRQPGGGPLSLSVSHPGKKQVVAADTRILIREATSADNGQLLALTKDTPMAGAISLRIDRDPDFFALLRMRGDAVVYVATCSDRVIGSISGTMYMAYVGGALERVAYIGDLKVHPQFEGRRISVRLISTLQARLKSEGIDLTHNLVAKGNSRVSKFCATKHVSRAVASLGQFIVEEILPSPFRKRSKKYRIAEATREELPEVVKLIEGVRRKQMFGRQVTLADLEQTFDSDQSANFSKLLVAYESGRIAATLGVEDVQRIKRNVLMNAPLFLRALLACFRWAAVAIPKVNIPRVGSPLALLYVRYMACVEGREEALPALIAEARAEAFRHGFSFLTVGLHENDPYLSAVAGLPRFTFHSLAVSNSIFTVDRVSNLFPAAAFEDFALV